MIQNLQRAIWDKQTVLVAGGEFSGEELRLLLRQAKLGAAIERVSKDLPQGFELIVALERDAGTVTLIDPDGNEHDDFDYDTFEGAILEALFAAEGMPP